MSRSETVPYAFLTHGGWCYSDGNRYARVTTGAQLARGSDCELDVAEIIKPGEPYEPKDGHWERTYHVRRVDGGELNVRVTSTPEARTVAKLPGNEEALGVIENRGARRSKGLDTNSLPSTGALRSSSSRRAAPAGRCARPPG
jgi:hypothetical protein